MRGDKPNLRQDDSPLQAAPAAPSWMPAAAAKEWDRCAPVLTDRRILTDGDLGSLENYCLAVGQVRDCQATLSGLPSLFFEGDKGVPRPHPALRVMHTAMTLARQMAAELGLTPVSRSRPALGVDADDNGGFGDLVD